MFHFTCPRCSRRILSVGTSRCFYCAGESATGNEMGENSRQRQANFETSRNNHVDGRSGYYMAPGDTQNGCSDHLNIIKKIQTDRWLAVSSEPHRRLAQEKATEKRGTFSSCSKEGSGAPIGKKKPDEFDLPRDTRFSSQETSSFFGNNANVAQSNEIMVDETSSGYQPKLSTRAVERNHSCTLCPKQFQRKANLIYHYRTHTGEKPFQCDLCGKGFSANSSLAVHRRRHTGEKPFQCDICGKEFAHKSNLKVHFRRHTGEKHFRCDICGKKFICKGHLENHYRQHTGERPFKCVLCDKDYATKHHLTRHAKCHTGQNPYKCGVCRETFKSNADRNRHHKLKHQ